MFALQKNGLNTVAWLELKSERPLNVQAMMFRAGSAVVLAFRGSQPVNVLDWIYNFTVNTHFAQEEVPLADAKALRDRECVSCNRTRAMLSVVMMVNKRLSALSILVYILCAACATST